MARTILAQLVLSLNDQLSSKAKSAASSLRDLGVAAGKLANPGTGRGMDTLSRSLANAESRAREFAKTMAGARWGSGFQKQLDRLKTTPGEIEKVRSSWQRLQADLTKGGDAGFRTAGVHRWKTETLGALAAVRSETDRLHRAQNSFAANMRRALRTGAAVAGVGGAAYATGRGIRGTVEQGAIAQRERARDYLGGLSASDTARLSALSIGQSGKYKSIDANSLHSLYRESATTSLGVSGTAELAPAMAQAMTVLQSLKGEDQANRQLASFLRGLDTLGKNVDPKQVRVLLDGMTKAAGFQGKEYDPSHMFGFAKYAKSAGGSLNDDFINGTVPFLMADMDPRRLGTSLGTLSSSLVGGTSMTGPNKKRGERQKAIGIRGQDGTMVQQDLLQSNPDKWAWEVLKPALERANGGKELTKGQITAEMNKMMPQTVADLFTKLLQQEGQYKQGAARQAAAPGLAGADQLAEKDPFVALESAFAQLRNAAAALADPIIPLVTSGLNGFASAASRVAEMLRDNPLGIAGTVSAGVATAGLGGYLALKMMKQMMGGAALEGAAVSLVGSAEALTAAAVRLGAGGTTGDVAKTTAAAAGGSAVAAGMIIGGVVVGGTALSLAATNAAQDPAFAEPYLDGGILGADPAGYALGAAVMNPQIVAAKLAAANQAAADSGRNVSESFTTSVANGVMAHLDQVQAAAASVMDRIRSLFGVGVDVPVRPQLGGVTTSPGTDTAPARASGGSVYAGSLYRINEFGEEYFSPAVNGRVVNGRQAGVGSTGASAPTISVTNNINVTGGPNEDGEALAARITTHIETALRQSLRGAFSDYGVEVA